MQRNWEHKFRRPQPFIKNNSCCLSSRCKEPVSDLGGAFVICHVNRTVLYSGRALNQNSLSLGPAALSEFRLRQRHFTVAGLQQQNISCDKAPRGFHSSQGGHQSLVQDLTGKEMTRTVSVGPLRQTYVLTHLQLFESNLWERTRDWAGNRENAKSRLTVSHIKHQRQKHILAVQWWS